MSRVGNVGKLGRTNIRKGIVVQLGLVDFNPRAAEGHLKNISVTVTRPGFSKFTLATPDKESRKKMTK